MSVHSSTIGGKNKINLLAYLSDNLCQCTLIFSTKYVKHDRSEIIFLHCPEIVFFKSVKKVKYFKSVLKCFVYSSKYNVLPALSVQYNLRYIPI